MRAYWCPGRPESHAWNCSLFVTPLRAYFSDGSCYFLFDFLKRLILEGFPHLFENAVTFAALLLQPLEALQVIRGYDSRHRNATLLHEDSRFAAKDFVEDG